MSDEFDALRIDVRANTDGFARDIAHMRAQVDSQMGASFGKVGDVLERGLSQAIRKGGLGFDDLKRSAFSALDAIAAQATQTLASALTGASAGSSTGTDTGPGSLTLASLFSSALGLPGRATGGNVAPGRGYVVGERGPEVFVPTSAGRIEATPNPDAPSRDVRVAITLNPARGASAPQALQRSSRQMASAVRRALQR